MLCQLVTCHADLTFWNQLCTLQLHILKHIAAGLHVQVVRLVYVDNPLNVGQVLQAVFPDLGQGLFEGDQGVRWDEFHMVLLIKETTVGGHPSRGVTPSGCSGCIQILQSQKAGCHMCLALSLNAA
jgi:hypothetical protein